MSLTWTDFDELRRRRKALGRPFILAHRGAMRVQPENTLRSFTTALDQGADLLETDLRFSADNEIVLMHDPTVDRTTGGSGAVREMTLGQLKALRARSPRDGSLTDQTVPTLRELIHATNREIPLALELKDPLFLQPVYGQQLVDLLIETGMMDRVAIISFEWTHVAAVKRVEPQIPMGQITMKNLIPPKGAQMAGPIWPLIFLNPLYIWMAHRRRAFVAPLDPDPEPRCWIYKRIGVDALLANDTASVLDALKG